MISPTVTTKAKSRGEVYRRMRGRESSTVREFLLNREVGLAYAILAAFVVVLQLVGTLGLDPFASLLVRLLLLPGYVVMLGYVILLVAVLPSVGQLAWLVGLLGYLSVVAVLLAAGYRLLR